MIGPRLSPIGIDLTGHVVRLVQGVTRRSGFVVRAWVSSPRPGGADQDSPFTNADAQLIAGLVRRGGFEGHRLALTLPRPWTLATTLELPPRESGAPVQQIARLELARMHRVDAAALHHVLWEVPSPARAGHGVHAMCVGVLRDRIDPVLDLLEDEGLETTALECASVSVARAANHGVAPGELVCVLDVGWNGLAIVLTLGGVVIFDRVVDAASWKSVCEHLVQRTGIDREIVRATPLDASAPDRLRHASRDVLNEFIARAEPEVARSLAYVAHRYPEVKLSRMLVCGEGWAAPGLCERLRASSPVEVRVLEPAHAWRIEEGMNPAGLGPAFALALGAASRDAGIEPSTRSKEVARAA